MALSEEILAAITAFRKENEDLVQANIRNTYKAKYGEANLVVGNNAITLPIIDDAAYLTYEEYDIRFIEALDEDGVDIRDALTITLKSQTGFTVYSPRIATLRWETYLKTPNFNFWT